MCFVSYNTQYKNTKNVSFIVASTKKIHRYNILVFTVQIKHCIPLDRSKTVYLIKVQAVSTHFGIGQIS